MSGNESNSVFAPPVKKWLNLFLPKFAENYLENFVEKFETLFEINEATMKIIDNK